MSSKTFKNRIDWLNRTTSRFWSKVDIQEPDDCWKWTGTKLLPNDCGQVYGSFCVTDVDRRVTYRAHRFSYVLAHGEIPEDHLIMHTCDTPLCVNPAHLMVGTHLTNAQDREAKGRGTPGELNGRSKLSPEDVLAIRASDETNEVLGERYGVHPAHISSIQTGKAWSHISAHERRSEK